LGFGGAILKVKPTSKTKNDMARVILAIQETLWPGGDAENEWSSDEIDEVADILERNGFGPGKGNQS
jgi:hypothetical protein